MTTENLANKICQTLADHNIGAKVWIRYQQGMPDHYSEIMEAYKVSYIILPEYTQDEMLYNDIVDPYNLGPSDDYAWWDWYNQNILIVGTSRT